jgi:hypothetical protein
MARKKRQRISYGSPPSPVTSIMLRMADKLQFCLWQAHLADIGLV